MDILPEDQSKNANIKVAVQVHCCLLLWHAAPAGRDGRRLTPAGPGGGQARVVEGMQHRLLAFFFRAAWPSGPASDAMFKFHGMFDYITSLVIWKVRSSVNAPCDNLAQLSGGTALQLLATHVCLQACHRQVLLPAIQAFLLVSTS